VDFFRKSYREAPPDLLEFYASVGDLESPEEAFKRKETKEKIESGFFVLSPRERKIFTFLLYDWELWEIAHVMKVSHGRVSQLHVSGLRKLRKLYGASNGRQRSRERSKRLGY